MRSKSILLSLLLVFCHKEDVKEQFMYISAGSGLVLRSAPNLKASAITLMPFGARIKILGLEPNSDTIDGSTAPWARVEFEKTKGFAFSGFLTPTEPSLDSYYRKIGIGLKDQCLAFTANTFPSKFIAGTLRLSKKYAYPITLDATGHFYSLPGTEYGSIPGGTWTKGPRSIILSISAPNFSFMAMDYHGCQEGQDGAKAQTCIENGRKQVHEAYGKEMGYLVGKYEILIGGDDTISITGDTHDVQPVNGFQTFGGWKFSSESVCVTP